MSLLGRLEDLSLPDIVQIVFLSRRTGVLEIIDDTGRHAVLFRQGLVVNASSPEHPDLVTYLENEKIIDASTAQTLRRMEEGGIPFGTAALEMNLITLEDLRELVRERVTGVILPLLQSREGEFNFILSDSMTALDIEYEPDVLFREGGLSPQRLLGAADGEKIKPLKGLEESLKAGKALLRGGTTAAEPPSPGELFRTPQPSEASQPEPFGDESDASAEPQTATAQDATPAAEPLEEPFASEPFADAGRFALHEVAADNILPFPAKEELEAPFSPVPDEEPFGTDKSLTQAPQAEREEAPESHSPQPPADRHSAAHFKVAGGLIEIAHPEAQFRNVVLFERNPLIRVAAKRAFGKRGVKISQFGSLDDVREAMTDLFRSNSFFVTFLELTSDDSSQRLMAQVKRKNPRLPVVIIDAEADLRRRHDLLRAGADLYLTKPTGPRLQPGLAEEELALFADELVLFANRAFEQWEQITGGLGPDAGRRFYEMAGKESLDRSFDVLKQLINELSNPNDIDQVASTILRLSAEYLDRGALFAVVDDKFVGLGGFGITGERDDMSARLRKFLIPRNAPSVLQEVTDSAEAHRGKIRKSAANVSLIERMGGVLPTEVVALPIVQSGRTIGILYGDNAEHRAPIDNVTGLEIFLTQAGFAFGNAVFASQRSGRL